MKILCKNTAHRKGFKNFRSVGSNGFKALDWVLLLSAFSLVLIGLVSLASTSQGDFGNLFKQVGWLALGAAIIWLLSLTDYRWIRIHGSLVLLLYLFFLLLLGAVYLWGSPIRGAQSWLTFGGLNVQPIEGMKIAVVLLFAKYFSERHIEMYRLQHIIISGMYVIMPLVFLFLQPDLGSGLVILGIWIGVMIIAGIKIRHLFSLGFAGAALAFLGWFFVFADYQKERFISFLNPYRDPLGSGYNIIQSKTAIGSGGFLGQGFQQGTQSQLGFLPEAQTDFIYAAITEEFGVLGAAAVLLLFALVLWRIIRVAQNASNNFARLAAAGFAIMIFFQLFLNVSMVMGLFPITGVPLPFVSYGGSSLLSLATALGILQSIKLQTTHM